MICANAVYYGIWIRLYKIFRRFSVDRADSSGQGPPSSPGGIPFSFKHAKLYL